MNVQGIGDPRSSSRVVAQSMRALEDRLAVIASNLASVNSWGHKRVTTAYESFATALDRARGRQGLNLHTVHRRDFSQGDLVQTGVAQDLALSGDGFFAAEKAGHVVYTRGVVLLRDAEGFLADASGARLLGVGGPIHLADPLVRPEVQNDGTVRLPDGEELGPLQIVRFADPSALREVGPGWYAAPPGQAPGPAAGTEVRSGYREASNVDSLAEMVSLISVQRQFQALQRSLTAESDMRDRLIQSMR